MSTPTSTELRDWFWARVDRSGTGCWTWTGLTNRDGYGRFTWRKMAMRAHRVAYELARGPIPTGLSVLHSCDNPPCVNPSHLRVGTQFDNMREMVARGRDAHSKKTHCPAGHEYSADNTGRYMRYGRPRRYCRTCSRLRRRVGPGRGPTGNAAKTECRNGHPFDTVNTYVRGGKRSCRTCNRAAVRRYQERLNAADREPR